MTGAPRTPKRDPRKLLLHLPAPALAAVGIVILASVGAGGFYAYRTYDYVQHDNDFCLSCHLMSEPFERFANSAHRGLGCKACHRPTLIGRSTMALTQIIENPGQLAEHAEVPNERCAECHIEGDPERWRRTANTVGHRIHLESDDPSLQGLKCVECHSSSVHQFAPVDRTCGQSGCHEDVRVRLGAMSDLTIHCAACHYFLAPLPADERVAPGRATEAGALASMSPTQDTCLSCHVMREKVQMPDPDPHQGNCGSCHNPHVQDEPADAAQSCTKSGCHAPSTMQTPFHRGLRPGILEDCTACHRAHDFALDGQDCTLCHLDVDADSLVLPGRISEAAPAAHSWTSATHAAAPSTLGPATAAAPALSVTFASLEPGVYRHAEARASPAVAAPAQEVATFQHAQHRGLACTSCHRSTDVHGAITVASLADCRSCHHTTPVAASCDRCHDSADPPAQELPHSQAMSLSVSGRVQRELPFRHEVHTGLDCATCHTEGLELSASTLDCTVCHDLHHTPETRCASCHVAPPTTAHPPTRAHVTCTGSGCHEALPVADMTWTRETCLACHQARRSHRAGQLCVDCHQIPAFGTGGEDE